MHSLILPEPIAAYFLADAGAGHLGEGHAVARCFTTDGRVLDEGHIHTGHEAIAAWKADTSTRYTYTAKPVAVEQMDRSYLVTSHVAGDFPGSPIDLRYIFTLERGKVATLEITS